MKPLNYIKVSAKVAEVWGITGQYPLLPDGNYALFWGVPNAMGYAWTDYPQMFKDTGGKILTPAQVRMEQEGLLVTQLDEPQLAKFRDTDAEPENPETETDSQTETGEDTQTPDESTQTEPESGQTPEPDTEPIAEEGGDA